MINRHFFKWISLLILCGLICFSIIACQDKTNLTNKSLPQNEAIQVYFNHKNDKGLNYQEPYREIERSGDNLEQIYIDGINSAKVSIDLAIQELRLPNIAKALVTQLQNGIKVRVIIENTYNNTGIDKQKINSNQLTQREKQAYEAYRKFVDQNQDGEISQQELSERDALFILKTANIPLIDDTEDNTKGTGLMHHKFMVIDNQIVITGSANLTLSGTYGDYSNPQTRGNANNVLTLKSTELAQLFTEEFNYMWGDGVSGNPDSWFGIHKPERLAKTVMINNIPVTVKFSPDSSSTPWELTTNGVISQLLNKAQTSIDLALFVFSDQKLVDTLYKAVQRGVKIRALIDPQFAFRFYSEGLDMLGIALPDQCRYEVNNDPWQVPIKTVGIPNLPKGDKLHHKVAIIDQKIVITGSHNWSPSANFNNDETLLIIEDDSIAQHYQQEFEQLYKTATLGIPDYLPRKIKQKTENCSSISQPTSIETGDIVNINTATLQGLKSLPGIGEKTAQKIILERQKQPFTSLEDLQRVSGIGVKKSQKLQGKVTF
ncbi:MAG: DUF655 domain-containing protein [Microcystaceae cyanobacterium]